jgi:hypothetical protein
MAVAYLAVFALLAASGTARAAYLSPAYPPLFALGAVAIEGWTQAGTTFARAARAGLVAVLTLGGAAIAPLALPLLPVERFIAYQAAIGLGPRNEERKEMGPLPQLFADMFGWPELAAEVARVYRALPPEEQATAAIFAQNYGEAGAIEFFGAGMGLPGAISGHNNYWLWGPGPRPGTPLIIIGGKPDEARQLFGDVRQAGSHRCELCMPYESDLAIWVARDPKSSLSAIWPQIKHFE